MLYSLRLGVTAICESKSIFCVLQEKGKLLQVLCLLLSDDNLQLMAAECLQIITNRKVSQAKKKYDHELRLVNRSSACLSFVRVVHETPSSLQPNFACIP